MSQRIEKGPKFTPAMGGAARRRPPTQPQQPQPPSASRPQHTAMSPPMRNTAALPGTAASGTAATGAAPAAATTAPTRSYAHTAPSARVPPLSAASSSLSSTGSTGTFKPPSLSAVTAKRTTGIITPGASRPQAAPIRPTPAAPIRPTPAAIRPRAPSVAGPPSTQPTSSAAPTLPPAAPPPTVNDEELHIPASEAPRRQMPPTFGAPSRSAFTPKPPAAIAPRRVEPQAAPDASTSRQPAADRAIQFPATESEQQQQQQQGIALAPTSSIHAELASSSKGKEREQPDAAAVNGHTSAVPAVPAAPPTRKRSRATPTNATKRRAKGLPEGHPTKPLTAYFQFMQHKRAELRETHPDASAVDVTKLCGEAWRQIPDAEREQWERDAAALREQYDADVAAWKERTPNWAALLAQAAQEESSRKRGRGAAAGGPKRPPSAYLLYTQETRKAEAAARDEGDAGRESFAEVNKRLGDAWRNLPLERKQPFLIQAENLKKTYEAELQKWREEHPDENGGGDTSAPSDGASAASDDESDYTDGGTRILISRSGKRRRQSTRRRRGRAHSEKRSISDDEREYAELVAAHGEQLADLRFDPKTTNMADLAAAELKAGRVSKRTFELERIRMKQLEDAAAARRAEKMKRIAQKREMKDKLKRRRRGEKVQLPKYDPRLDPANRWTGDRGADEEEQPSTQAAQAALMAEAAKANAGPDQEEVGEKLYDDDDAADVEEALGGRPADKEKRADHLRIPDLDSSDDEGGQNAGRRSASRRPDNSDEEDDGAASDAGSTKTATSAGTFLSLRENAHAPQMRIVDGRIVIDESSLNIQRSTEQVFEEGDMIDEEAGHKFVNSSTGSKRQKSARWDARETEAFYRAVGMWGTDFEMIARMFPERTRKQIKTKWTREERQNPARLDAAFARRIPVDLGDYAIMANVDLSGPPPKVGEADGAEGADVDAEGGAGETARNIKKAETAEPEPDGGEPLGESSGAPPRKTSQTPDPSSRHAQPSTSNSNKPRSQLELERERSARGQRERARRGTISGAPPGGLGGIGVEHAGEEEAEEEVLDLPTEDAAAQGKEREQAQELAGDW